MYTKWRSDLRDRRPLWRPPTPLRLLTPALGVFTGKRGPLRWAGPHQLQLFSHDERDGNERTLQVSRNLCFRRIAVREELLLVVHQLLAGLSRELLVLS